MTTEPIISPDEGAILEEVRLARAVAERDGSVVVSHAELAVVLSVVERLASDVERLRGVVHAEEMHAGGDCAVCAHLSIESLVAEVERLRDRLTSSDEPVDASCPGCRGSGVEPSGTTHSGLGESLPCDECGPGCPGCCGCRADDDHVFSTSRP